MDIAMITIQFLLVAGMIHFTRGNYTIMASNTIRPGLPLALSVNIDGNSDVTLVARIMNSTGVVVETTQVFVRYAAEILELQVPQDADVGVYKLQVSGIDGIIFEEEESLSFSPKGFSVFIQTDKAIYKPGQTINLRIFAVNPDLSPHTVNFDIEVKDPLGNLIQQWIQIGSPTGVVTEHILMSTQPVLGDWMITATAGSVAKGHVVTVSEYVLPKFEVSVTLPSFITVQDTILHCRVDAKYTFGKPVRGSVTVQLSIGAHNINLNMDIVGSKDFLVTMDELKDSRSLYEGVSISAVAVVTETLTGIAQNGTSSTTYHVKPVKIVFLEASPNTFKPQLRYTAYLGVTRQDGSPLTDIERSVPLIVEHRQGYSSPWIQQSFDIPTNGVIAVTFDTSTDETTYLESFNIKARYYTLEDISNPDIQKTVSAAVSPSNTFIQIILSETDLSAGNLATFTLLSTENPGRLTYQVISKGNIVAMGAIADLTSMQNTLAIEITADMAPSARLIVNYIREDGEFVVDAFNFNVDGAFKNEVSLAFSSEVVEPGDEITVHVNASPRSYVGLLAVDQSVLLLKSGNDITQQQVLEELETFDSTDEVKPSIFRFFPYPSTGDTASEVLNNAGVLVLTDGEVYEQNNYYYHYRVFFAPAGSSFPEAAMPPDIQPDIQPANMPVDDATSSTSSDSVRTEFPETWLWTETTTGDDGTVAITTTVPDTITSWIGSAFALSTETGLGVVATASSVRVFKPFFVSLNLPYSVIRGERLAFEILVFNYLNTDITAEIMLHKSMDYDNIEFQRSNYVIETGVTELIVSRDQVVSATIPAGDGVTVSFPIIPKYLKLMDIYVTAQSTNARDAVVRQLLVEPEGVMKSYTDPMFVTLSGEDIQKDFLIVLPPSGVVEGTIRAVLSATGDIMGPTMSGLDELLRMPTGCGEQTMLGFAPDVFIYDYLIQTNQNDVVIKEKALGFMKMGYQRELTYKHKDGSFSAFGENDPSGSTWLTAFVVKSFVQSQDYISIDYNVVEKALNWLVMQQNPIGSFPEPGKICHKDMQGGLSGPVTLTAYVLIALQESQQGSGISQRTLDSLVDSANLAADYIQSQLPELILDPYALAITTYALTLSNHTAKDAFLAAFEALAIVEDGMKHWSKQDLSIEEAAEDVAADIWIPPYMKSPSSDVEMTAYGLLAYLTRDDILSRSSISKWLTKQRSELGGYSSTQDTVVALQALASYAGLIGSNQGDIVIDVMVTEDPSYSTSLNITPENARVFQLLELPVTSGNVSISIAGTGSCLVQFTVSYNVEEVLEKPSFDVDVTVLDVNENHIQVTVCGRYLKQEPSGMSIMEIGIPSGFYVDEVVLKLELSRVNTLQKYEVMKRNVILYLDEITYETETCVTISALRVNIVSNVKPSIVKVYNYYQPGEQQTQMYVSETLKNSNILDLCASCGQVLSLTDPVDPSKPSAGTPNTTPNPALNMVVFILSCFWIGITFGIAHQI